MKKSFFPVLLCVLLSFAPAGCGMEAVTTEPDAEQHYFEATVLEISDTSLLVQPREGSGESASAGEISVYVGNLSEEKSTKVLAQLEEGDLIGISYLGPVAETWPAQISNVYRLERLAAAKGQLSDYPPAVMVDGKLYLDTGRISNEPRCGVMDGQIDSTVEAGQLPAQDDQSNFGSGYGYQYGREGSIEVNIDGNWYVFEMEN